MKIGIYGGSFNPVHKGHINIAKEAIKVLKLDKLYFVPSFKSPFKSKEKYANVQDRINMIKMVKPKKSYISEFEAKRKGTSFTIDTVLHFKKKFPDDELFLIIGSDNVNKLNKWRDINKIAKLLQISIFKRSGKFSKVNIKKYNCILINNCIYDFASSNFRKGSFENLDKETVKYIGKNKLYILELAKNMVSAKRYKHLIAVGSLAASLAKKHGLSAKNAWTAGVLHDIAKEMPIIDQKLLLDKYKQSYDGVPNPVLHQYTSYIWAKEIYKIPEEEVTHAISVHTTAALEMSRMDKVVYVADKLSDGRKFEGIQKEREIAFQNLDKAFSRAIARSEKHILQKHNYLDEKSRKIIERWK